MEPILTDEELIDAYVQAMDWRNMTKATKSVRRSYLEKFSREVGFRAATQQSVQTWLSRPSLQPQSRNVLLTTIHCAYKWFNAEGYFEPVLDKRGIKVDFDPTLGIPKPKTHKGSPHPISEADLKKALGLADRLMRCWLMLGAYAGCRCQEIAGVRREDINDEDPEDPWLNIEFGKGNKSRSVPLHPEILEALRSLPMRSDGPLWDMSPQDMSKAINTFLHKEVGTKSTAHSLRHYFGTNTFRNSLDLQLTADLLGHADTSITSVYAAADHRKAAGVIRSLGVAS